MTEILRFEMNVSAEVALKHPGPGKPIEGRYGNRVMYTLADDRIMYVAPIVASQITDLGIQPGERFQVRKQLRKQGSRRLIEWDVRRVTSEPESQLERELRESIAAARNGNVTLPSAVNKEANPQQATPAPAVSTPADSCEGNASTATRNENTQAQTAPEDAVKIASSADPAHAEVNGAPPGAIPTPVVGTASNGAATVPSPSAQKNGTPSPPVMTKLEHALKTAITAAYNAEKYGAELGYVVRFDPDAIKSMAITVLINMSEGGRR